MTKKLSIAERGFQRGTGPRNVSAYRREQIEIAIARGLDRDEVIEALGVKGYQYDEVLAYMTVVATEGPERSYHKREHS